MDPFDLVEDISHHRWLTEGLLALEILLVLACLAWAPAWM